MEMAFFMHSKQTYLERRRERVRELSAGGTLDIASVLPQVNIPLFTHGRLKHVMLREVDGYLMTTNVENNPVFGGEE